MSIVFYIQVLVSFMTNLEKKPNRVKIYLSINKHKPK